MHTYLDCIPCLLRQSLESARRFSPDPQIHEQILRDVLRLTLELDLQRPPPWVGQRIHRRLRELTGVADPYLAAKQRFNRLAREALPALAARVDQAADPLLTAAGLAVAANAIDLGVAGELSDAQVREALAAAPVTLHGDLEQFRQAVHSATDILCLADNAGEIVVDRLLVEQLGPARVTVAVRGRPVLNDATLADVADAGFDGRVAVIANGSDAPGTILDDCSPDFQERFRRADLILAKGQGNFETLSGVSGRLVFLLKAKCPVIAEHVGLPVGTHALLCSWSAPPSGASSTAHLPWR